MWFRIVFSDVSPPLGAVVGSDQKLYWRLVDVGRLLHHKDPYRFSRKYDRNTVRGKDILPAQILKTLPLQTQRAVLAPTQTILQILSFEQKVLACLLDFALEYGHVKTVDREPRYVSKVQSSPLLHLVPAHVTGCLSLSTWISAFVKDVNHFYVCGVGVDYPPIYTFPPEPVPIKSEPMESFPMLTEDPIEALSQDTEAPPLSTIEPSLPMDPVLEEWLTDPVQAPKLIMDSPNAVLEHLKDPVQAPNENMDSLNLELEKPVQTPNIDSSLPKPVVPDSKPVLPDAPVAEPFNRIFQAVAEPIKRFSVIVPNPSVTPKPTSSDAPKPILTETAKPSPSDAAKSTTPSDAIKPGAGDWIIKYHTFPKRMWLINTNHSDPLNITMITANP